MKKAISLLLILTTVLVCGTFSAIAENTTSFNSDELAYASYRDISSAYHARISYLENLDGLWESLLGVETFDDIDNNWVTKFVAANMDMDKSINNTLLLVKLASKKFGVDSDYFIDQGGLVKAIKDEASARHLTDPRSVMWIILGWAEECEIVSSKKKIDESLKYGMENIRQIMSIDKNYAYLNELKDYYKEAFSLHEYASDFSDNYVNFQQKLKQYQENYDSWEIDFDFIFGTDAYDTYGDSYDQLCEERGFSFYSF